MSSEPAIDGRPFHKEISGEASVRGIRLSHVEILNYRDYISTVRLLENHKYMRAESQILVNDQL